MGTEASKPDDDTLKPSETRSLVARTFDCSACRQVKKPKPGSGDSTGRKVSMDVPDRRGAVGEFNRIGGAAGRYTSVGDGSVHAPAASHRCSPQPAGSPAIALYPPHRPFDAEDTVMVMADKDENPSGIADSMCGQSSHGGRVVSQASSHRAGKWNYV